MDCEIIKSIAVFGQNQFGLKELNIVRWFDKEEKFDIRIWSVGHERFKGGITLSYQELVNLKEALDELFISKECAEIAGKQSRTNKTIHGIDEIMHNVYRELIIKNKP